MIGYAITAIARADIVKIEDYTARRWGEGQARRYIAAIYATFDRLALNPGIGRTRSSVPADLRLFKVGSHYIAYAVPDSEPIDIIRVLHQAMDFAAHLPGG